MSIPEAIDSRHFHNCVLCSISLD